MMKKHEFTNGELTEKAMEVYSNSSFTFQRPGYTYKGWTVVPTGDDVTDIAPDRQNKS